MRLDFVVASMILSFNDLKCCHNCLEGFNVSISERSLRDAVVQKNLGDGLVLTRGQWSWDIQEQSNYQFTGLMQYVPNSLILTFSRQIDSVRVAWLGAFFGCLDK